MGYCDLLFLFPRLNYYRFGLWQYIPPLMGYLGNLFSCVGSNHGGEICKLTVECRNTGASLRYLQVAYRAHVCDSLQMAQGAQFLINYGVLIAIENLSMCFSRLKAVRSGDKATWTSGRDPLTGGIVVTADLTTRARWPNSLKYISGNRGILHH